MPKQKARYVMTKNTVSQTLFLVDIFIKLFYSWNFKIKVSGWILQYVHTVLNIIQLQETSRRLEWYLHWTFRTSFLWLFISLILSYTLWIFFFTGVLLGLGRAQGHCMTPSFENKTLLDQFICAFQLSWATFSTVVRK